MTKKTDELTMKFSSIKFGSHPTHAFPPPPFSRSGIKRVVVANNRKGNRHLDEVGIKFIFFAGPFVALTAGSAWPLLRRKFNLRFASVGVNYSDPSDFSSPY